MRLAAALLAACSLTSCTQWVDPPQSLGDVNAGYRYVAIEPLPVAYPDYSACKSRTPGGTPDLLDAVHDMAARVSVLQISGEGSAKFAPVNVSASGSTYEVTQDFIAYDEATLRFEVPPNLAGGQA